MGSDERGADRSNAKFAAMSEATKFGRAVLLSKSKDSLFIRSSNVHGGLQFGTVYWQPDVWVNGVEYTGYCLGMHPPDQGVCHADFLLPDGAIYFRSDIGLARQDIHPGSYGQCIFEVRFGHSPRDLDDPSNKPFFTRSVTGPADVPEVYCKDLQPYRFLRLSVYSAGSNHSDHAVWCNPRFTEQP